MSLTGVPLILTAVCCTLATIGATAWVWSRWGRARLFLRPAGVLLAEALLLFTVGLVVNRSEQFYPTWSALLDSKSSSDTTYRTRPGDLDRRLAARAGARIGDAQVFPWQPTGWSGWRLADAPTVITPPAYLLHPTWRYSAVLVVDDNTGAWTAAEEESAARRATATGASAVVVFVTTTAATSVATLATVLPNQLGRDLRVTVHRWAMVSSAADTLLAQRTVVAAPGRFPSIVSVRPGARVVSGPTPRSTPTKLPLLTTIIRAHGHTQKRAAKNTTAVTLPAGIESTEVVSDDSGSPHQTGTPTLLSTVPDALYTALAWAIGRTAPPLAASSPPVTYVKVHRLPRPSASAGPGKPRHVAPRPNPHPSPSGS